MQQLTIFLVVSSLLHVVSLLLSTSVVQARPPQWGILSSWKGWHPRRRRRHQIETVHHHSSSFSSLLHHQQGQSTPSTSTTFHNNTLNYTAITILHVGSNDQEGTSSSSSRSRSRSSSNNKTGAEAAEERSSTTRIPQTGCLLLEYPSINETRIYSNHNNKQEKAMVSSSSWKSKWIPGSSSSNSSRSSWTTAAQNVNDNGNNDNDDAFLTLAQASAMTSHVVVLVLHKTKTSSSSSSNLRHLNLPPLVQALLLGFVRRHEHAGLNKGSLLIVLNDDLENGDNEIDIDEWRSDLVLDDFKDVQPRHVYALEITNVQEYESTLKNLLDEYRVDHHQPGNSSNFDSLVPLQAFPMLLQQTYHSLLLEKKGSHQQDNTTASSLFDEQADSSLLSTTVLSAHVHVGGTSTTCRLEDANAEAIQAQVDIQTDGISSSSTAAETITTTSTRTTPAIATVNATETDCSRINVVAVDSTNKQQGTTTSEGGADLVVEQNDVMNNDSSLEQYEQEQAVRLLLAICHERLDALEQELEQVWFDTAATMENDDDIGDYMSLNEISSDESSSSSSPAVLLLPQPPPCDFAKAATLILHDLQQAFSTSLLSNNKQLQESVTTNVGSRLSLLYQQHLQSLRDYHGKVYESMLDNQVNQAGNKRQHGRRWWRRRPFLPSRKRRPISAARVEKELQRTVQAFRKAAQEAVPPLARRGNPFRDMDLDYVNALQGLLADMQEAIALRESLVDDSDIDQDDNDTDEAKRQTGGLWGFIRRGRQQGAAATWYEKLAARAFVLAVNYVQGWLAWQALQRAALEREREMPKFPIF